MCIGACAKPLKLDSGHLYGLQWELAMGARGGVEIVNQYYLKKDLVR